MKACVVFYDSHCSLCQNTKEKLQKYATFRQVKWVSTREENLEKHYSFARYVDFEREMYVLVDDTYVYGGYDGVIRLLRFHPLLRMPLFFGSKNPIRPIGKKLYEKIAANRPMIGSTCKDGLCKIS
ncbi:thiol-disulfide oxidoreductase DCC family protein [Geomicrobium sp. JCM 19039]|uniref:thiol-disulfide oxidoreductase DCC family protein n=1 Tax=Geomicrobium sp. JCM 19039 TaxID=1460636 RepID=UPI00045F3ADD|nr:DCC1-like thiol-disulfide oxidoreductase family protein [Geomicrobium sp. JCM 19039]GAK13784.1 hypothetical protein JCM19039_3660 [Geomicrobium sp. JCM 19039]